MLEFHTVDRVTKFVMAVCVLHNICIMKNDTMAFYDSNLKIGVDNDTPVILKMTYLKTFLSVICGNSNEITWGTKKRDVTNNLPCGLRARH